jgi:GNAT superfamily N-acetyltransferase
MNEDFQLATFDLQAATDQEWARLNEFKNENHLEIYPDDPPLPAGYTRNIWFSLPEVIQRRAWVLRRPDGRVLGNGYLDIYDIAENRHVGEAHLFLHPDVRRKKWGSKMLAEISHAARAAERRLLLFPSWSTIPAGGAFLTAIGAQPGLETTENQLVLAEVSRDLLHAWQARAAERAGGYELDFFTGPYSDEWLVHIAAMKQAMNQAPTDDLEVEDMAWTPEILRQIDTTLAQRGIERWTLTAREKATGEPAGYTEIMWQPHKPTIGSQGDTAVLEAHRNRGLGRWLKAAMLQRVLAEKPEVEFMRTNNADSNAPMLRINEQLGFRPYIATTIWQVSIDAVDAYLQNTQGHHTGR